MTTLQTTDGRLLRASRPSGIGSGLSSGVGGGLFRPMWSDGSNDEARPGEVLRSYAQIYNTQPVVAAAVDKLSRRIATLPFDAYKQDGDHREVVTGDTLDSLIRHPMPRWSTLQLLHYIVQHVLVHGNAVLAKVRGADPEAPPEGLWPLDWAFMSAYAPQGGRIEWWSTTQFEGHERFIAVEDTVHFAWAATWGEIGVSPLQKLGVTLRLEDAAQRHQIASFRNGARPGGVFTLPAGSSPSKEQLELTRAGIKALYSGVDNAHKTALLAAGAKWEAMSMSPVEVELIEQRKLNLQEVGMVYDLPGPLMNDLSHATLTNVVEINKALYRDIVPPWLSLIEQTLDVQLLAPEPAWLDRCLKFDLSEKLKGEPIELANTLKIQVEAGLITRNEARRILGMAPVTDPEADKLTMNANNQAPIDFHRTNQVLATNTAGTEVNPPAPAVPVAPATP